MRFTVLNHISLPTCTEVAEGWAVGVFYKYFCIQHMYMTLDISYYCDKTNTFKRATVRHDRKQDSAT